MLHSMSLFFFSSFSVPIAIKWVTTSAVLMSTTVMRSVSVQTGKDTPETALTSCHRESVSPPCYIIALHAHSRAGCVISVGVHM